MKITRRFTQTNRDVFDSVEWTRRSSRIMNPDGSVVFEMNDVEAPADWSQLATDIMVSKYFRKAGVPRRDEHGEPETDADGEPITGPERSVRQVVHRLCGCWRHWGEKHGYFDSAEDGRTFYDELAWMLLHQVCAPNSPQWFNTGLHWAYGINGPAQGHWYTDPETGETRASEDAYTHPQPHACFIQSVDDDLVNPGGVMDLWTREARLFKYGSGTGTNFSSIRAEDEALSGGGRSSGLMSFLKIGDRAAGAIKSGGTTRRAAKMVCLDLDHPDVEQFINWKVREEVKVAALAEGMKNLSPEQKETADRLGLELDYDFNGEAYQTVSGQNSNNSVRIPNSFFHALDRESDWELTNRTDHEARARIPAKDLWERIGYAAWRCADPGVQYDSTINEWHTCPASGRINASNPCSEYMFLDNTACNLASINLLTLYDAKARHFDVGGYEHAVELWTVVLEISVLMAQYPSKEIARLSHEYRTLGLGYANLGAMLMQMGVPYDSDMGRAIGGTMASILTGRSYAASAAMAAEHGPFAGYFKNKDAMLRVIRNHRRAAHGVDREAGESGGERPLGGYEGLEIPPVPIDGGCVEGRADAPYPGLDNGVETLAAARRCWDDALKLGEKHGYRNAQATVIAPTGTIGLLMDCDTTGVEPDFSLVKFKKLAGGGYFKIANQSLRPALSALGYDEQQADEILTYVLGTANLDVPMPADDGEVAANAGTRTFAAFLEHEGFDEAGLEKLTAALAGAMDLSFVFNVWTLGGETIERLGLGGEAASGGDLLRALGLSRGQIVKLNEMICGTGTIEGAPHLAEEHYPVFDCANTCGRIGERFIAPSGHIHMMAAVQPFISGAISKTINLPHSAGVDDIQGAYRLSWELGLKANALYRDGCKLSQPLNTRADEDDEAEDEEAVEAARGEVAGEVVVAAEGAGSGQPVEKIVERIVERPMRRRLPDTRRSITHKFNVAGHEGYLTVGLYEDGHPGELFITMAKEGSTIGGLMDSLGTAISVAFQYGVPVDSLVNKFSHQRFEPAGMTGNRDIPFAKSLVDYIFRWMGMQFVPGYREANAPKRPSDKKTKPETGVPASGVSASAGGESSAPWPRDGGTKKEGGAGSAGDDADQRAGKAHDRGVRKINGARRYAVDDPKIAEDYQARRSPFHELDARSREADAVIHTHQDTGRAVAATLDEANSQMMGDAPACEVCGSITVRNGTCYKCLNCGNSMGCS